MYLHSSTFIHPVRPTPFVEDAFLFSLYSSGFFVKNQVSMACGCMSGSLFKLHWSTCVIFMPIPCCFYYYYSVVKFEVRGGDTFRSSFIVQDYFGYPVFCFPYEVEYYSFKVCKIFMLKFWWEWHWNCKLVLIRW